MLVRYRKSKVRKQMKDITKSEASRLLEFAVDTAKKAGMRLRGVRTRSVNSDAGNDVKLQEDIDSEKFIREKLAVSNLPVIGEENGGDISLLDSDKLYWVVDPIDGTFNFLRGMPNVCVSIGLMRGRKPVVGAIYDFTRDEMFSGGTKLPLCINSRIVKPNWASDISQAVMMTGFPSITDYSTEALQEFIKAVQKFKKVRMCGSAALAMAYVACGRADLYREIRVNLWDIAAGLSLMESAGAVWEVHSANIPEKPLCLIIKAAAKKEFIF